MLLCSRRSERSDIEPLAHVMTGAQGRGQTCGGAEGVPPVATAAWCPHPGRLTQSLATGFHRFLTRFSGRRRSKQNYRIYPPPWSFLVVVLVSSLVSIVDACSSRTIPRPRPFPASTPRPDVTLPEYKCQEPYSSQLCLNGATCFMIKIRESEMYNCRCSDGYLGFRCEYKDLDGSYIHSQGRYILETASIAGGATAAVFSVVVLCVVGYFKWHACSSRTTPKPRPPAPTPRPNITFHTYECPPNYAAWFCLNGATCFTVKIGDSLLYNCECADGYMGSRCEYKDLDGSYLPSQRRFMLETASIAGGATIAVFSVVILCVAAYLKWRKRQKHQISQENQNPEGGNVLPPPEKVLSVRQECSGTQHLRTVSAGDEPSLRPCPIEVSSPDPLPLDRGDHRMGQGTLVRTGPPWNNV